MNTLALLLLSLLHTSASVFVRIASLKYNTFLGVSVGNNLVIISEDTNPPNSAYTWLLNDSYISTLDSNKYLGIENNVPVLSSTKIKWNYNRNDMKIYPESGNRYLILNDTAVSLQPNQDKYNKMIMFAVSQSGGRQIEKLYTDKILSVEEQQHNLTLAINNNKTIDQFFKDMKQLKLEINGVVSDAEEKIKEMKEMTVKIVKDSDDLLNMQQATIDGANNTLNNIRFVVIPDLMTKWEYLQYVPQALVNNAQSKSNALLVMIENATATFNQSITDLMDRHRVLPQGSYDWIVIFTMVCYVIYFVDVFLRISKPRIGKRRSNLTMEMEQQDLGDDETPGISPEYYLTEETTPAPYERDRNTIQGELKFHN